MSDQKAVVYSKDACGYCIRAINLLERKGVEVDVLKIGPDITLEDVIEKVGEPVRTVPQIFIGGEYIGGYDELCAYYGIRSR